MLTTKEYIYEGLWKDGVREGFGKIAWKNGNSFEGEL